jgi:homoserine dehydrogenase
MARKHDGRLEIRVHPVLVPANLLIARVDGVLNVVEVQTDLAGQVLFLGSGAGSLPTASAVVADIVEISRGIVGQASPAPFPALNGHLTVRPMAELETRYYLRLSVAARPGVLDRIADVLDGLGIRVDTVLQSETNGIPGRFELVLITGRTKEATMQHALRSLGDLECVHEVSNMVRVGESDGSLVT